MIAIEDFIEARLAEDAVEALHTTDYLAPNGFRLATLYAADVVTVQSGMPLTAIRGGRALADIAVTRAVLAEHQPDPEYRFNRDADGHITTGSHIVGYNCSTCGGQRVHPWPCRTVLTVASRWQRHPDFDKAWRLA